MYFQQCFTYKTAATEEYLKFIDSKIEELIHLAKLDDLCEQALDLVIERDTLNVNEINLFKFAVKWMEKAYESNGIVSLCKLKPDLFTADEAFSVFRYCSTGYRDDQLVYSTKKRNCVAEESDEGLGASTDGSL